MSHKIARIVGLARGTRLARVLRRTRKPPIIWPAIARLARPIRAHGLHGTGKAFLKAELKKPLPAWSLILLLLAGIGAGFATATALGLVAGSGGSSAPDFSIGASPASMTIPQGNLATYTISLNSLNGFAGSVTLNVTETPIVSSTLALNPVSVSLFTGTASSVLTIPVPSSQTLGVYTLAIVGLSGVLSHNVVAILVVTVPPQPDFQIQSSSTSMSIVHGSSGTSTITLTSVGGFSGVINLSDSISTNNTSSPTVSLNPIRVTLLSGATSNAVLTINTTSTTAIGSYTIVVQGVSGGLSNTVSITLQVQ